MYRNKRTITMRLDDRKDPCRLEVRLDDKLRGKRNIFTSRPIRGPMLEEYRTEYSKLLSSVFFRCKGDDLYVRDLGALYAIVSEIRRFGVNLLGDLFRERSQELRQSLVSLMAAGIDDLLHYEIPLGIIEYEGNLENFIPLDYLFISLTDRPLKFEHPSTFRAALSQVLGFAFIIQRNVPNKRRPISPIAFTNRLPIDIYANESLSNANRELDFFRKDNSEHFAIDIDWPSGYGGDAAATLVNRLRERRQAQINHYLCHCVTLDPSPWNHRLVFGSEEKKVSLELAALRGAFLDAPTDRPLLAFKNTFTFLNACASASVAPSRTSFPDLFLGFFDNLGFIGPEYTIPETFACDFARVFYANWLRWKHLGTALFKTRWFFAKKYCNPLGLFYTLYADPDLQLSEEKKVNSVNLYARSGSTSVHQPRQ